MPCERLTWHGWKGQNLTKNLLEKGRVRHAFANAIQKTSFVQRRSRYLRNVIASRLLLIYVNQSRDELKIFMVFPSRFWEHYLRLWFFFYKETENIQKSLFVFADDGMCLFFFPFKYVWLDQLSFQNVMAECYGWRTDRCYMPFLDLAVRGVWRLSLLEDQSCYAVYPHYLCCMSL